MDATKSTWFWVEILTTYHCQCGVYRSTRDRQAFSIQENFHSHSLNFCPWKTRATFAQIQLDKNTYLQPISNTQAKYIFVFCPKTYLLENNLSAREFCDYFGIAEDPAVTV